MLPQVLKFIFEVQMKRSNEKITRKKKKPFQLPNCDFVFFGGPFWTPPTFKASYFLISCSFKQFTSAIGALPSILQSCF